MSLLAPTDFDNPTCIIAFRGANDIRHNYIDKFEPIFLKTVLGLPLYKALIADFDNEPEAISQRFLDLWNGCEYDVAGVLYEFLGCKSAAQFYVKSEYLYGEYRTKTGVGDVILKSAKSTVVSPWAAIVDAYNEAAEIAGGCMAVDYSTIHTFLTTKLDIYPEFEFSSFVGLGRKNILGL